MATPLVILGTHVFAEEVADRERVGRTVSGRPVIRVDELAEHAGDWSAVIGAQVTW